MEFQREKTLALAESLGLVVAPEHILDEVGSGADPFRPLFMHLWKLVDALEVLHVVAYRTDRLARDELQVASFIRHCRNQGVRVHYADGTRVETDTDELVQYILGFEGRKSRMHTLNQTMEGRRKAAQNNRMPNGTGVGLYGCDYDRYSKKRTINDAEAAVVRLAYEWRLDGASYTQIAKWLNEMGIRSKRGGLWSPGTIRKMLTNPAYTSFQTWGGCRFEKQFGPNGPRVKVTKRPEEEGIPLVGYTPMIIEPSLFMAVQAVKLRRPRKGIAWEYWLTEFFVCGECGSLVCGANQTDNAKSRKHSYPYYRCEGTLGDHYRPKVCGIKSFRADKLEPVIDEHIAAAVENPEGFLEVVRKETRGGGDGLDRWIKSLDGQLRKKELEADTLAVQNSKGLVKQRRLERLIRPLEVAIERLEEELAQLRRQKADLANWELVEERVREAFSRYGDGLAALNNRERQRLMRLLNVKVTAFRGRVLVTGTLDPALFTIEQTLASRREHSRRSPSP